MATCSCPMPIPVRSANGEVCAWRCSNCNRPLPVPDPRDAEIARLKAEVARAKVQIDALNAEADMLNKLVIQLRETRQQDAEKVARLKRALAAGPAALRVSQCNDRMDHDTQQISRVLDDIMQRAAVVVEAAQAAAMKEGT